MPYYLKGTPVVPSRAGSDAWLGRRRRVWAPIGEQLSSTCRAQAPDASDQDSYLIRKRYRPGLSRFLARERRRR